MLPERSLGMQEGLPTKKPKEQVIGMCLSFGGPGYRLGLPCCHGCVGGNPDSPRPRAPPILLGGTSDQGSLTWPWHLAQVSQDRLTLVVCVGREEWDEWARWTSPL